MAGTSICGTEETFTSSDDKREVMPVCIVAVSHILIKV